MLDIKSKKEVEMAHEKNKNRFADAKKILMGETLKRDASIIETDVLPNLKHTIALIPYFKDLEWFHFTLPIIDFEGYELTEEEKDEIMAHYYLREGILWKNGGGIGEISRASLIGKVFEDLLKLKNTIVFKECQIDKKTKQVHFKLHLIEEIKKVKMPEESMLITAVLDKYLKEEIKFEAIADEINRVYESLSTEHIVELYQGDLNYIPVLQLNVDDILRKTDFFSEIELPDESLKIDIYEYVKNSKHIKSLQRKLKKYGYKLNIETKYSDSDPFRHNLINGTVNADYSSVAMKDESLVKSEVLREAYDKKKTEYDNALTKKALKQNESLIELVESGHFDEMVAQTWVNRTIMSTQKIIDSRFKGTRANEEVTFRFTLPFDREIENLIPFKRKYHVSDGIGNRYLQLENNVLDALKKRYPFLEHSRLAGNSFYDFQHKEGVHGRDDFHIEPNTLDFWFIAEQGTYRIHEQEILEWIASYYGVLDIEDTLNDIQFTEEGISQKIQGYMTNHCMGEATAEEKFKIILGKVDFDMIFKLYQESPLYEKTKEKFEDEEKNDIFFWTYSLKEPYKVAKLKEFQSLKLANLFAHALMVSSFFERMKEELEGYGYELKIEYVKENKRTMETGRRNLPGDDMPDDVCVYSVQLVVE